MRFRRWGNLAVLTVVLSVSASTARAEDYLVFLLAGQSNMVGDAPKSGLPSSLRSAQTDIQVWYNGTTGGAAPLATNTWVNLAPGTGVDFGPEVTFGRVMVDQFPEYKIRLIKYSVNSTSLHTDWNPNNPGPRYQAFLDTADAALNNLTANGHTYRIGGMLWVQGEEDSKTAEMANAYASNLTNLINNVRAYFDEPKMPFLIGRIPPYNRPYNTTVRSAQVQVANADDYAEWVNLDSAQMQNDDQIHFSAAGYQDIGEWFADSYKPNFEAGGFAANAKLSTGTVTNVGSSWYTVTLNKTYSNPVVIATVLLTGSSQKPAVARVRNAGGSSFGVRVQNPSDATLTGYTVHYMVVEAGVYNSPKMEAGRITPTSTDRAGSWGGTRIYPRQSFSRPVVLGQVMSANDPDWSSFWARGSGDRVDQPDQRIFVGKHVGQDSDTDRANETIGYVVLEAGAGTLSGVAFTAGVTGDTIQGIDNDPPYGVVFPAMTSAKVALLSTAGVDGVDGGWPILYGNSSVTTTALRLAIDEDQISDGERLHTTESVAYAVFADGSTQSDPGGGEEPTEPQTLTIEAENFAAKSVGTGAAAGSEWVPSTAKAGYSGSGSMTTAANTGVLTGDSTVGARMDYTVNFPAAGTYYIWLRLWIPSGSDDTIHAGLLANGPATYGGMGVTASPGQTWAWGNLIHGTTTRSRINVAAPGSQTFSVWLREDGIFIDKIILTQDASLVPTGGGSSEPPPPPSDITVEAESFTGTTAGSGAFAAKAWVVSTNVGGFSGSGAMHVAETAANAMDATTGPRLDYAISFPEAGTWYVWLRGYAGDSGSDSCHIGLNGTCVTLGGSGSQLGPDDTWAWFSNGPGSVKVQVNVPSPGTHTINVWMREDGLRLDRLFLTRSTTAPQ